METIHGFDFFRLRFDKDGKLRNTEAFDELKQHAATAGTTDVILISHGFINDENDALGLYTAFLRSFQANLQRPELQAGLAGRKFAVAGVIWPSKQFNDTFKAAESGSTQGLDDDVVQKEQVRARLLEMKAEDAPPEKQARLDRAIALLDEVEGSPEAQNELVDCVLSLLDGSEPDPTEGLDEIRSKEGTELLDALSTPVILPTAGGGDGDGGTMGLGGGGGVDGGDGGEGGAMGVASFFGSIFGKIGGLLNLTTWYMMKNRSGVVGANGVAQVVRDVKASPHGLKVHLVGHSLGGRLMAACAKSLRSPKVQPDSVSLLEAAFSHYGFSKNNGRGKAGFFRAVIDDQVVRGPFLATFSAQDTVVGIVYALASRLAGDSTEAVGDASDPFGGIGRNGAQRTDEAASEALHAVGRNYTFPSGKVLCLDGSGGLITNHSDVTNPTVTYAVAAAVAQT